MVDSNLLTSQLLVKICFLLLIVFFLLYYLLQRSSMNETIAKTLILNKGFPERIVHLDLKGAPLRVDAYRELFPLLHQNGATGLLIEYEDMFPFTGRLSTLARRNAYSKEDIQQIIQLSTSSNLEVIPLVQTFGHLEFVLKQPPFTKLSENALELNTICISNNESWTVITEMIDQIRSLHQSSTRIHIGADEAYHVGEDAICREKLKKTFDEHKDSMGVAHIARVAKHAHNVGFSTVFAWNDMFEKTDPQVLKFHNLHSLITPVVWGYKEDVTVEGYFSEGLFDRLNTVFPSIYFATAFKGANGIKQSFSNINRYLSTHQSYNRLLKGAAEIVSNKTAGIFVTGWSRYSHHRPLCELLPTSLPSLFMSLIYLQDPQIPASKVHKRLKRLLNCKEAEMRRAAREFQLNHTEIYYPPIETEYSTCHFLWAPIHKELEDLRFLTWLSHRVSSMDKKTRKELREKLERNEKELRSQLSPIFFDETIDEFIAGNFDPLKRRIEKKTIKMNSNIINTK